MSTYTPSAMEIFEHDFGVVTSFTHGFANSGDAHACSRMFNLLHTAAHMKPEARTLVVNAVSAELGLKPLPEVVIATMRTADEPLVDGEAARHCLKYVYFQLASPPQFKKHLISGLGYTDVSPQPKALNFHLEKTKAASRALMKMVRKSFDGDVPRRS